MEHVIILANPIAIQAELPTNTMKLRRTLLLAFAVGLVEVPLASFAQLPVKVYRVGWLQTGSPSADREFIDAVKKSLRNLGYSEGKNIAFDFRYADGRPERLAGSAAELAALKPDVIISGATPGTRAARQATATIPIVMIGISDPVGAGFVASLARPGGNITGVANMGLDMAAKPLELLHTLVPRAVRIAVLAPDNPAIPAILKEILTAAKGLGVTILPTTVTSPAEIDSAFAAIAEQKAEALIVIADSVTIVNRQRIAERAAEAKLPAIYQYSAQVEAGGLFSYGPNPHDLENVVASYIDKILKGAKPGELPVQQPTEFEMVINMRTAKALGITFPPEILLRADKVIQ